MKRGWIKHYRTDLKHLKDLSDPEYRYYQVSLLLAIWDPKNKQFGTFDARTKTIREHLNWANGKINETKNLLLGKGYYKKAKDWKLEITNSALIFGKSKKHETIIQHTEKDFHTNEADFRLDEQVFNTFFQDKNNPAIDKGLPWNKGSLQ